MHGNYKVHCFHIVVLDCVCCFAESTIPLCYRMQGTSIIVPQGDINQNPWSLDFPLLQLWFLGCLDGVPFCVSLFPPLFIAHLIFFFCELTNLWNICQIAYIIATVAPVPLVHVNIPHLSFLVTLVLWDHNWPITHTCVFSFCHLCLLHLYIYILVMQ